MNQPRSIPVVLSIAGSDSSCGAGLQADTKSITALGGYALNAVTSVVSEVPGRVSRIELMPGDLIADQLQVLAAAFPIAATKTGMIGGEEQLRALITTLTETCAEAFSTPETAPKGRYLGGPVTWEGFDDERVVALGRQRH